MELAMFTIMIFLFFFFLGILGMFWYQSHRLGMQLRELSEEHAQLRVLLRALESRVEGVAAFEKTRAKGQEGESRENADSQPGHDPLLHLSFDKARENPAGELNLDGPLRLE